MRQCVTSLRRELALRQERRLSVEEGEEETGGRRVRVEEGEEETGGDSELFERRVSVEEEGGEETGRDSELFDAMEETDFAMFRVMSSLHM